MLAPQRTPAHQHVLKERHVGSGQVQGPPQPRVPCQHQPVLPRFGEHVGEQDAAVVKPQPRLLRAAAAEAGGGGRREQGG